MGMEFQKIGARIRTARKRKEWRQDDLAEHIGKSTTYVGMIERGERIPALDTFIDIITELDITADEILCDVVKYGYQTRLLQYEEKIKNLEQKDQQKLFGIMDVYLGE